MSCPETVWIPHPFKAKLDGTLSNLVKWKDVSSYGRAVGLGDLKLLTETLLWFYMCMHRRQNHGVSTCAYVVLFFWYINLILDVRKSNNLCWFIFSMWHLNNMILIKWGLTNKTVVQQKSSLVLCHVIPLSYVVHWCQIPGKQKTNTQKLGSEKVIIAVALPKVFAVCIQFYILHIYIMLLKSDSWLPCRSFASLHCDIKGFLIDWVAFISSQHSCFSDIHIYAKYKALEDLALVVHASLPQSKSKQYPYKMWEWGVMGSIQYPLAWHLKLLKARLYPGRTSQNSLQLCFPVSHLPDKITLVQLGRLVPCPSLRSVGEWWCWWRSARVSCQLAAGGGLGWMLLPMGGVSSAPHACAQEKLVAAEDLVLQVKGIGICMKHKVTFWVSQIRAWTLLNLKCNCNFLTNAKWLLYSCSDCSLLFK